VKHLTVLHYQARLHNTLAYYPRASVTMEESFCNFDN
jgi:hypothetical protein